LVGGFELKVGHPGDAHFLYLICCNDVSQHTGGDLYKWKKDQLHKDHWDVTDRKGNKVKEVTFDGRQLWPNGPKNNQ
jgi:hypothetical protein